VAGHTYAQWTLCRSRWSCKGYGKIDLVRGLGVSVTEQPRDTVRTTGVPKMMSAVVASTSKCPEKL
jgi:hypothetical protein